MIQQDYRRTLELSTLGSKIGTIEPFSIHRAKSPMKSWLRGRDLNPFHPQLQRTYNC